MSQADELLNGLVNEATALEDEPHIVIREDRTIEVPDSLRRIGVQHDHDVETVTFDCPRYWDEHDFLDMKIFIHYMRSDGKIGRYLTTNLVADSNNANVVHFDWTISRNVTRVFGDLSFIACAKQVDSDGEEKVHWNSELNKDMYVSEGLEPDVIEESDPDVITQLLTRMDLVEKTDPVVAVKYYTDAKEVAEEAKAEHKKLIDDIATERARLDRYLNDISTGQVRNTTTELDGIFTEGHAEAHVKSNGANAIFTLRSLDKIAIENDPGMFNNRLFLLEQEELYPLDFIRHRLDSIAEFNEFTLSPYAGISLNKQDGHWRAIYEKSSNASGTPMIMADDGSSKNIIIRVHSVKAVWDGAPFSFDSAAVTIHRDVKDYPLYQTDEVCDILAETDGLTGMTIKFNDQCPAGTRVEMLFDLLDPTVESKVDLVIAPNAVYLEGSGACLITEPLSIPYPLANRTDPIPSDELYDIRIDVDGKTHLTAGEAVRSQHRKTKELVENLMNIFGGSDGDVGSGGNTGSSNIGVVGKTLVIRRA